MYKNYWQQRTEVKTNVASTLNLRHNYPVQKSIQIDLSCNIYFFFLSILLLEQIRNFHRLRFSNGKSLLANAFC